MLNNRGVITYYFPMGRQNVSLGFCRSGMYTSYQKKMKMLEGSSESVIRRTHNAMTKE
jgi:hypothetical protein